MRVHLRWSVSHALLVRCSRHKRHSVWQVTQVLSAVCNGHNANIKCIHLFRVLLSTQWTIEFTEYKMHAFIQRIAVYTMDNRMYRIQNACIYSAYCCLHNGQSNIQSTKCTYSIQRVAACNGQLNVQDTTCTRLFSVLMYAMDKRMYRVQNVHIC